MDIKIFIIDIIFVLLVSAQENIFTQKHICPPQLYATLRKYSCEYYQPTETSTSNTKTNTNSNRGIIPECCQKKCSEYYLVTSYCKRSTIELVTENPEILNEIAKEENTIVDITQHPDVEIAEEKVINNMLVKDTAKVRKINGLTRRSNKNTEKQQKNKKRKFKNERSVKINEDCVCTCKKRKRKDERKDKPSVIGFFKSSSNPPIPVRRSYRPF